MASGEYKLTDESAKTYIADARPKWDMADVTVKSATLDVSGCSSHIHIRFRHKGEPLHYFGKLLLLDDAWQRGMDKYRAEKQRQEAEREGQGG